VNNFWNGFLEKNDPVNIYFFLDLFEMVFSEKIMLGSFEQADILLESCFGPYLLVKQKKWKYSFFFSGESQERYSLPLDLHTFYTAMLRCKHSVHNIINVPLFIPYLYCYYNSIDDDISKENISKNISNKIRSTIPPKNIVAIISNGCSAKRNFFLDELEKVFQIDYRGPFRNNAPIISEKYNTKEFQEIISEYKFILTFENSIDETYVTEKITHGFLANIIPIYWGTKYVKKCFNRKRFITLEGFEIDDITKVIQNIKFLSENEQEYLDVVNQPVFNIEENEENENISLKTIAREIQKFV
jgi:hypothetical protein